MDKARKKELLKAYADKQRQSFKDSLPMDEELFWNLFDYVDEKLEENDGCDHSLTFTREFLGKTKGRCRNRIRLDRQRRWRL